MPNRRTLLTHLAHLLPAAFLAVTGVAKLVGPEGTPPGSLARLLDLAPWSTWLRLMGVLECGVALLLALPRTRPVGRYAAFLAVAALTTLLALNAHDTGFVANCGCMGALAARRSGPDAVDWLLLRNAALLATLVLAGALALPALSVRQAFGRAATFGVILLLAALYAAQRVRAEHVRQDRDIMLQGRSLAGKQGWLVPDVPVRDLQGAEQGLRAVVRPGDHLLVLATDCEHCAQMGADVVGIARRVAAAGGRLLLLVVEGEPRTAHAWLEAHGYGGIVAFALASKADAWRLGLSSVPARIVLGPDGRVAQHEEHGGLASLMEPLTWSRAVPESLRAQVWAALASTAAPGATPDGPARMRPDGSYELTLRLSDGGAGRLLVRRDGFSRAYGLEIALALGADGRLLNALALAAGDFAALAPEALQEVLDGLRGLTIAEARQKLLGGLAAGLERGSLARSVYLVLERVDVQAQAATGSGPGR